MYKDNLPGIAGVKVEQKENKRYEDSRVRRFSTIVPQQRCKKCLLVFLNITTNDAELERASRLAKGRSNDRERIRKRTDTPL